MIDLHCHILPGVDDGARTMDEALALASASVQRGISHCVCTPHLQERRFVNEIEDIEAVHEEFAAALVKHDIPLKTHYAAEVRLSPNVVQLLNEKRLPFIGYLDQKPVLLLELPHSHIPAGTEQLIAWLNQQDVVVMVAHPERNREIVANFEKAYWLKSNGVLFQATAGAFAGSFSEKVQKTLKRMVDEDLIDVVASDAHNLKSRPPEMDVAYQFLANKYGQSKADNLCVEKPWSIASCWFE